MNEAAERNLTADPPLARLRKADAWTGLVLAIVAAAMVGKALTFPLTGTYAGVKNAWYVSPALFPLIVGGMLFILSLGLMVRAFRDHRRLRPGASVLGLSRDALPAHGGHALLIAALLAAYIVGLIPRVDFILATALFLLAFIGAYFLTTAPVRILGVAALVLVALAALGVALWGAWPASRSAGQEVADAAVAAVLALTIILFVVLTRGADRRRVRPVVGTAIGTALILSAIFKYGLLVPLPREGAATMLMDAVVDPVLALAR
ncbi:MAG: hypothetical protein AcusKO_09890 [Acuticoccus sp.]